MIRVPLQFIEVPAWVVPAVPDARALYEVMALLGLEGQWVRISAADQRRIMGHAPFGKQEIQINDEDGLMVRRASCFGTCKEAQTYSLDNVQRAIAARKSVSPGTFGPNYMNF